MQPTANLKTEHQLIRQRICTELEKITEGSLKYMDDAKRAEKFSDGQLLAFCNEVKRNRSDKEEKWDKMQIYLSLFLIVIEEARQEKVSLIES